MVRWIALMAANRLNRYVNHYRSAVNGCSIIFRMSPRVIILCLSHKAHKFIYSLASYLIDPTDGLVAFLIICNDGVK